MESNKKLKTIHFILPGGGVKGCFQAGFMYHLFKHFSNYFEVYQIDGCSVGALNGLAISSGNIDELKLTWDNIKCMNDVFSNQSSIPIWNGIKTVYNGYYYKGIYRNNLKSVIYKYGFKEENYLDKFNCVATNIRTGVIDYVNGTNKNIRDYVLASSNPWIVASPVEVEEKLYTDGALLETYPIKYLEESEADLKVIVGYDETHFEKFYEDGKNMLFHISRIIDICRNNNINIKVTKDLLEEHPEIIKIDTPMNVDSLYFEKDTINEGFKMGMQMAANFVVNYLI